MISYYFIVTFFTLARNKKNSNCTQTVSERYYRDDGIFHEKQQQHIMNSSSNIKQIMLKITHMKISLSLSSCNWNYRIRIWIGIGIGIQLIFSHFLISTTLNTYYCSSIFRFIQKNFNIIIVIEIIVLLKNNRNTLFLI